MSNGSGEAISGKTLTPLNLADETYSMQLPRERALQPPTQLTLRFWGTRGSIPVSGADYIRYGGNTSCVTLTSNTGHLYIFDCGSGARVLGNWLLSPEWQQLSNEAGQEQGINGYIFLSHTHWDHIQGFPFFTPVFKPGNRFHVIGCDSCSQPLNDALGGQMQQCYFPVGLEQLPASINFHPIDEEEVRLDGAVISSQTLKHPIPTTAFRVELGGKVLVYATDHEPLNLPKMRPHELLGSDVIDPKLVKLAAGADVLIHDAQYSTSELPEKVGWGHNSGEIGVDTAIKVGAKKLVLYHHDPAHDDNFIDKILEAAQKRAASLGHPELEVVAACDGLTFEL